MLTPNPAQGAALRLLGMLPDAEVPTAAAHWLLEYDSPALRELAGAEGSQGWLIDQLWPEVLCDLGVNEMTGEQAWDRSMAFQIAAWRAGERSALDVMAQVIRAYVECEYPEYLPEASRLVGLADELEGGFGRTPQEVLAAVDLTLAGWATRRNLLP